MLLGCIGDDFTGSSDLANTLARAGMHAVQYCGVPHAPAAAGVEAGIVALKTRTAPVAQAVAQSLQALDWLRQQGCEQFLFKYCSTFDSTPQGNIGPVADALADALGATHVVVCPVYPSLGRTLYGGHLFVNGRLLNESGMQDHPLTPMTDPDIRRWLSLQTPGKVGHVAAATVLEGRGAIRNALDREHEAGARFVVTDTIRDADLIEIGAAVADLPLVTGGSGIALGLPDNFRAARRIGTHVPAWRGMAGPCVAISGSCSTATRAQVARHGESQPALEIRADDVMSRAIQPGDAAGWAQRHDGAIPLVYSSTDPETVAVAQARHGKAEVAAAIEHFLAETARLLAERGFTRIVCAGGETSGAVVEALGATVLEIGPEIDPGVPALAVGGRDLALALKSGNFGGVDFFGRAAAILAGR